MKDDSDGFPLDPATRIAVGLSEGANCLGILLCSGAMKAMADAGQNLAELAKSGADIMLEAVQEAAARGVALGSPSSPEAWSRGEARLQRLQELAASGWPWTHARLQEIQEQIRGALEALLGIDAPRLVIGEDGVVCALHGTECPPEALTPP